MARMSLWSSAPPTAASTSFPSWPEELVRLKVDVILASAGPAALAARKATTSVPVVFVGVVDPVGLGACPEPGPSGWQSHRTSHHLGGFCRQAPGAAQGSCPQPDRKSTRLNSSHLG